MLFQHTAVDLLSYPHHSTNPMRIYQEPRIIGAYVLDQKSKKVTRVFARKVVLASGGLSSLYLHSTNPEEAIGNGIAMAARAGARLANLEYIQFHPTALSHREADSFLISEAVRGEGARLMNLKGEYFMDKYNPTLRDLAPRDEVAVAIWDEMIENSERHVLLDIANFVKEDIPTRFPSIYAACMQAGIDITKEPAPVVPGAHYFCGGVHVNSLGRTTLNGLYAVGEVSCTGLHGANRLASTSLLEGLVWGYYAARDIAVKVHTGETIGLSMLKSVRDWIPTGKVENEDPALIAQDWMSIKSTMWNYVGIVRTRQRLKIAIEDLRHMYLRIEEFYRETPVSKDIISLFHGTQAAILVADAAFRNRNSIGCHFLRDYKDAPQSYPAMRHNDIN